MKDTKRPYRIGKKGNGHMWFVAGLGFIGSLAAFIFSFLPTNTMNMGSHTVWFAVLFGGVFVFVVLPFIILACRKKSWLQPGNKFVPFHWEKSPEAQAAKDFEAEQAEEAAAEARLAAAKKNEDPGK